MPVPHKQRVGLGTGAVEGCISGSGAPNAGNAEEGGGAVKGTCAAERAMAVLERGDVPEVGPLAPLHSWGCVYVGMHMLVCLQARDTALASTLPSRECHPNKLLMGWTGC